MTKERARERALELIGNNAVDLEDALTELLFLKAATLPRPALSPPDTSRHVIGFFADQKGGKMAWNWEPVYYNDGLYLSVFDDYDYTAAIQYWADVQFPEQEAKWPI